MKRFFKWFLISLLLLSTVLFSGGYWFLQKSITPVNGTLQSVPLQDEATIYRDEWGIPHIYANSLEDVFFSQGYAQAQDRLFELDLSRRAVRGELSEIFGKDFLDTDKFFLTVGFYRAAEQSKLILSKEGEIYLQRFADGVNAFIADNKDNLPIEFTILNYKPDSWIVEDSLAIGKYMSWVLGGNMQNELLLMAISEKLGEDKASELFPSYPKEGITIMKNAWREVGLSNEKIENLLAITDLGDRGSIGVPGIGIGSNNWVVSGSLTESGKPILANDMHLEIKAPSIWYQNHLKVPGKLNITGVIFPGVPGVIVGHNDSIAWGVTNLNPDVQDLYIEKRNVENPYQFEYMGKWENATVFHYDIPVKGMESIPYEVIVTRHGPIISEIFGQNQTIPLSLKWTNLQATTELDAVIKLDQAHNWESFKSALNDFKVPAQNFVYADIEGNIGYRGNGLIPIRSAGSGLLPVPGWTGEYEWEGFIPYDELPTILNPEQGFIVTANNKVIDDEYPYFLTYEWAPPYRASAIFESLDKKQNLTLDEVISIQNNWDNLQARELASVLKSVLENSDLNDLELTTWKLLQTWLDNNPQDLPNEAGPIIYHTLYQTILKNTFLDEMELELYEKYISHGNAVNTLDRFLLEDSKWFDDISTNEPETKATIIKKAFSETVAFLSDKLGKNNNAWQWSHLHTITYDHPLGSQKGLDIIFNRGPFLIGGSSVTAGAASYPLKNPYEVTSAGPWRFGVDLGDMDKGLDILFGGSSGHPLSDHYDDQIEKWLNGEYKTTWFNDNDIVKASKDRVTILRP